MTSHCPQNVYSWGYILSRRLFSYSKNENLYHWIILSISILSRSYQASAIVRRYRFSMSSWRILGHEASCFVQIGWVIKISTTDSLQCQKKRINTRPQRSWNVQAAAENPPINPSELLKRAVYQSLIEYDKNGNPIEIQINEEEREPEKPRQRFAYAWNPKIIHQSWPARSESGVWTLFWTE